LEGMQKIKNNTYINDSMIAFSFLSF
jgi:hypothetical protein